MKYQVDLTKRAERDLRHIFVRIQAGYSRQAGTWFNALEKAVMGLEYDPLRGARIQEDDSLRQVLFGKRRNVYRIIYKVEESQNRIIVIHIRHSAQVAFTSDEDI